MHFANVYACARRLAVIWVALQLGASCGGGGGNPVPPDPIQPSPTPQMTPLMLPMADGTQLDTHVYLPGGDGPWPVVLIRTPYGNQREADYAADANAKGYAVVSQDMRGRYDSQGANIPFIGCGWGEKRDGYDTLAWIHSRWWCNGRIGMTGGSALGTTQNFVAPTQPPGLVCQFLGVSASSLYHEWVYEGGALREEFCVEWLERNKFDPLVLETWQAHPAFDTYWQQYSIREQVAQINAPGMHLGGWYDIFCQGTLDSFTLRQHHGGSGAAGKQWLVMGPWTHGGLASRIAGEAEFPSNAEHAPGSPYDQFMDYYLNGTDTGILQRPPVTYYLMGPLGETGAPGNYWLYADDWPPPSVEDRYYLHSGGNLTWVPQGKEEPTAFTFDPADPSPTLGGRNLHTPAGMFDQQTVEARSDVIEFTSGELGWPAEVTGRITARLYVASDAVDSDVALRLCDVYPDGRSMLITEGILRLRYRNGFETPQLLTPGQVYAVDVDLWSTAYVFNKGHRIRLDVSGGNWPRWDRNPGTGLAWEDGATSVVQQLTLYHDSEHRSFLNLPVVVERDYMPIS